MRQRQAQHQSPRVRRVSVSKLRRRQRANSSNVCTSIASERCTCSSAARTRCIFGLEGDTFLVAESSISKSTLPLEGEASYPKPNLYSHAHTYQAMANMSLSYITHQRRFHSFPNPPASVQRTNKPSGFAPDASYQRPPRYPTNLIITPANDLRR